MLRSVLHFSLLKPALVLLCLFAVALSGSSLSAGPYTLYPPLSLQVSQVECSAYLVWQKPQEPGGNTPPGLVGYYIYRDGLQIGQIGDPNSLTFFDYDTEWGTYTYTLTANYDLTPYGIPGQFGESPFSVPCTVVLNCDFPFPFYEDWSSGTFGQGNWKFFPDQANWTIDISQGNPLPAVVFKGLPVLQDYDVLLRSLKLNGAPWMCADLYLEFDYKLTDVAANGSEKLDIQYFRDSTWYTVEELANNGSTGWTHMKFNISQVCGSPYRIGFRAKGLNSSSVGSWMIDNIRVYADCKGPVACNFERTGNNVRLFWQPPQCEPNLLIETYSVYRSEVSESGPFVKLNADYITGLEYTDAIPAGYPATRFWYYTTILQYDFTANLLCEKACDTLEVDLLAGIGAVVPIRVNIASRPGEGAVMISSDLQVFSCELVDIQGKSLIHLTSCNAKSLRIQTGHCPAGIYFIRLRYFDGSVVIRKVPVLN
jgi:hypothetical protein